MKRNEESPGESPRRSTSQSSHTSLSDIHSSVAIPKNITGWRKIFAFFGPAYLVSVGYMDPGNWATDIEGGARFGYTLIWVLVMSNGMAMLLQTLSARLGIATGRDLAQACRDNYPPVVAYALWFLAEVAIAACDLAEVLGTAIGIHLLFHLPVLWGVVIAGFDTILLLAIQNLGVRKFEAFIVTLVATIGGCFLVELFLSKPDMAGVARGFVPALPEGALLVAIGIIGATVMPHNLYLHSALVQTRAFDPSPEGKRSAEKFNLIDTIVALNAAFFVNAAILALAAATFHKNGVVVTELEQAHQLISPLLGTTLAGTLFAVALLAAGQSSTLTGTLAGQIIMEGFLHFKIRPFLRRLITRMIAIVPAIYVLLTVGDKGTYQLLIVSQVVLSLQLPFAIIPLVQFTSNKRLMGAMANAVWVQVLAWVSAAIIVVLNVNLVADKLTPYLSDGSPWYVRLSLALVIVVTGGLLVYITVKPLTDRVLKKSSRERVKASVYSMLPEGSRLVLDEPKFMRIGVTVAFSDSDRAVLSHACSLARQHGAALYLFHVVEGVGGVVFGDDAFDAEAREDELYLQRVADALRSDGLEVTPLLGFGDVPREILRLVKVSGVDCLVMGGHGHRGLWDVVFGATISPVRHGLSIPMVIVR
jgi:manganese transport protein